MATPRASPASACRWWPTRCRISPGRWPACWPGSTGRRRTGRTCHRAAPCRRRRPSCRRPGGAAAAARAAAGVPMACAASGGWTHPPFALWPVALRGALREALLAGEKKIDRWTARFGCAAAEWPTDPVDPFFNANAPEDLAAGRGPLASRLTATHTQAAAAGGRPPREGHPHRHPLPPWRSPSGAAGDHGHARSQKAIRRPASRRRGVRLSAKPWSGREKNSPTNRPLPYCSRYAPRGSSQSAKIEVGPGRITSSLAFPAGLTRRASARSGRPMLPRFRRHSSLLIILSIGLISGSLVWRAARAGGLPARARRRLGRIPHRAAGAAGRAAAGRQPEAARPAGRAGEVDGCGIGHARAAGGHAVRHGDAGRADGGLPAGAGAGPGRAPTAAR